MSENRDNGKAPTPRPLGKPAIIATKEVDIRPKRMRAPRPPGSPITMVKKGIG